LDKNELYIYVDRSKKLMIVAVTYSWWVIIS